jgi:hypothetical protein
MIFELIGLVFIFLKFYIKFWAWALRWFWILFVGAYITYFLFAYNALFHWINNTNIIIAGLSICTILTLFLEIRWICKKISKSPLYIQYNKNHKYKKIIKWLKKEEKKRQKIALATKLQLQMKEPL